MTEDILFRSPFAARRDRATRVRRTVPTLSPPERSAIAREGPPPATASESGGADTYPAVRTIGAAGLPVPRRPPPTTTPTTTTDRGSSESNVAAHRPRSKSKGDGPPIPPNIRAHLILDLAAGVGPRTVARLRAELGTHEAIVAADAERLSRALGRNADDGPGPRRDVAALHEAIQDARGAVAAEWRRTLDIGASITGPHDASEPRLLADLPDPPVAVRWIGTAIPCDAAHPTVAIVGGRRAGPDACGLARQLAEALARQGVMVVSGGALGVDAAAHAGALDAGGRTVVVLGAGLAHAGPKQHASLFRRIVDAGGTMVSAHRIDQPPKPHQFPRRNRIIAALAHVVVVIAAGRRSGALITARLAADELGRDVLVAPGPAGAESWSGGHELLRDGAGLVEHVDDIMPLVDRSVRLRVRAEPPVRRDDES